jgi:hypothetical protein
VTCCSPRWTTKTLGNVVGTITTSGSTTRTRRATTPAGRFRSCMNSPIGQDHPRYFARRNDDHGRRRDAQSRRLLMSRMPAH